MGIKTTKVEAHWNYLLSIENDLEVVSRFIELHEDNFKCFSIEISRLLMAAAAEVDVVCKQICKNEFFEIHYGENPYCLDICFKDGCDEYCAEVSVETEAEVEPVAEDEPVTEDEGMPVGEPILEP